MRICGQSLTKWKKEEYGSLQYCIKHKQKQLDGLLNEVKKCHDSIAEEESKRQLQDLLGKEEMIWK